MKLRSKPYPKTWFEILLSLSILILLPVTFVFDIFFILPTLHEPYSFWYYFNIVLAVFLNLNIEANMLAGMLIDTSVDCE